MGWVSRVMSGMFYKLGERIATSPKYFIIIPIILTVIFASGFLKIQYVNDVVYLYTQTNGRTHFEEKTLNRLFPSNYNGKFDPSRISQFGRFARVIVTTKEEGSSVLTTDVWNEILVLDNLLHNVTITWKDESFNYTSLCANWFGTCFENEFLDLSNEIASIQNGSSKLNYPVGFNAKTLKTYVLPLYFGDITLTEDAFYVKSAKAILLNYVIAVDSPEDSQRGKAWELGVLDCLKNYETKWKAIKVWGMTLGAWADEMDEGLFSVVPHFLLTTILMGAFTVVTSMMIDWVKSKPWLGFAGPISAVLGTYAGGGIMCFIGVPFVGINMILPFLMLGIGIDDTFVMLASWRRTSPNDPVPKRLAECYADAAMSVTITTLTDMTSFYVGALTTIPSIQIFSYYAGTCILCIYIYQLCFFGGIMAISGYHEAENKHSVFWWIQAVPKSKADGISKWKRLFFIGGVDKADPSNLHDTRENVLMVFFRESFSNFIFRPGAKILVILTFIVYIGISLWGIAIMDVGLRRERIVRYDSFLSDYLVTEQKYFRRYSHRIQVVVDTPLDYSQKDVQNKISNLFQEFYNIDQISELWSENWLRDFTRFVENYSEFFNFNTSTEKDFINTLREHYLNEKSPISTDILFNENKTQILATRYIIQSQNIFDVHLETDMVLKLREVCANAEKNGLKVSVYFPWFHFNDQIIIIGDVTKKLVAVAAVIVMSVAIILIPNLVCALSVLFSIVSIEIGVLGFMSLWGVSLDLISVLSVIMCIGFSVDFSAHISYAFITSEAYTTEDKMRDAMFSLGLPILQGAISTIIGIAALMFADSYIFQVFFKVGVLVIVFALWHSLFLLPVLLLLLKPDHGYNSQRKTFVLSNSEKDIHKMGDSNKTVDKFTMFSSNDL